MRRNHTSRILLRILFDPADIDPAAADGIVDALDDLSLLHDLAHDTRLLRPVGRRPAAQRLVAHAGVAHDAEGRDLAAQRGESTVRVPEAEGLRGRGGEEAVRAGEVEGGGEAGVEEGERHEAEGAGAPVEGVDLAEAQGRGIGPRIEGLREVNIGSGKGDGGDGGLLAPEGAVGAGEGPGGGRGEGEEVRDVGSEEGREGVVEVARRIVGAAEGTLGEDVGPVLEVEEAGLGVDETGTEGLVVGGEDVPGADRGETVEEDVDGYLES